MSAQNGNAKGQAGLAESYYLGEGTKKNNDLAKYWAEKSANQECVNGMYILARILMDKKDVNKAIHWYKEAANKDHVASQYSLGVIYANGDGVIRDYQEARYWFEIVAKNENDKAFQSEACYALSNFYINGLDVDVNYYKAVSYLLIAAEYGNPHAQYKLGILYSDGLGVPQSRKEAKSWFKKAAKQGYKDASIIINALYKE